MNTSTNTTIDLSDLTLDELKELLEKVQQDFDGMEKDSGPYNRAKFFLKTLTEIIEMNP